MEDLRDPTAIVQLKIRMREPLRARLEEEAKFHGRSINSEVVDRLARSFERQDLFSEMLGFSHDSHLAGVLMMLGSVMEQVGYLHTKPQQSRSRLGSRWAEDPEAFDQAALAAITLLNAARPRPESGTPSTKLTRQSREVVREMLSALRHNDEHPIPFTRTTIKLRSLLGSIADRLAPRLPLGGKPPDAASLTQLLQDAGVAIAEKVYNIVKISIHHPSKEEIASVVVSELTSWVQVDFSMRGNITRRGKNSWRLKFDVGADEFGHRKTRYVTVKGKRQDAQRELTRVLAAADAGTLPEPSKVTVAEYVREWLDGTHDLSPKTAERYRELAEQQIIPHLGAVSLQRLKPAHVRAWHSTLIKGGGKGGRALAPRTVGHAHRVLHRTLQRAVEGETLARNVASVIPPPKVEEQEIGILGADQIAAVMDKLKGHPLYAISALALSTGMRRGELLAVQWDDCDFDALSVRVERSLEQTGAGLRFKGPKTKSRPPHHLTATERRRDPRTHRRQQFEVRLALGMGNRPPTRSYSATRTDRHYRRTTSPGDGKTPAYHSAYHGWPSTLYATHMPPPSSLPAWTW